MLALLLLLTHLVHGAPTPVEPDYVVVDANAWLYAEPRLDGPRLRAADVDVAPEHARAPVVVLARRAVQDDMVLARVVTHAPRLGPGGRPLAPDVVPGDWRHCYPQPVGLAQLGVDVWVRAVDLLPVITTPVSLTTPAGDRVDLLPGLALQGTGPVYRVLGHHLSVLAAVPPAMIGRSYPLDRVPLTSPGLVAVRASGTDVVHPTWRAELDLRGEVLTLRAALQRGATPAAELRDRCMAVVPHAPLPAVPTLDRELLRGAGSLPILVGLGSRITRRDGTVLGAVAGGEYVLWSRATCTWEGEEVGLCCDPPAGLETAGEPAEVCFQSELPIEAVDRAYRTVIGRAVDRVAGAATRAMGSQPEVSWRPPVTEGSVSPAALDAALKVEQPTLLYCYERAVRRDPTQQGTLTLRFGVASDGHGREPRVVATQLTDQSLLACVGRRIQAMLVPEQVGAPATIVDLELIFDPHLIAE